MPEPRKFKRPPLAADAAAVKITPNTLERELIFSLARSRKAYQEAREVICIYDPEKQTFRQDFTTRRYNTLYRAIAAWWERWDKYNPETAVQKDAAVSFLVLHAHFVDWCKKNQVSIEEARELEQEIKEEEPLAQAFTYETTHRLLNSEAFKYWLSGRAADQALGSINNQKNLGFLTLEVIQEAYRTAEKMAGQAVKFEAVNAGALLTGKQIYRTPLRCDLTDLNKAVGGGFRYGETTLIAATNNGGKTVLACQLALHFALQDKRVAFFTTERTPAELLQRKVSNYTSTLYSEFTDRKDVNTAMNAGGECAIVPGWLWEDPRTAESMQQIKHITEHNIIYMDWARGPRYTIQGNLDHQIQGLVDAGWNPDVIIFDWIGGGLEKATDHDKIRHMYQEGIDHIVNHGKKFNRLMIALAQLNNAQAAGKKCVTRDMLAECKSMTNNVTNFIGISNLVKKDVVVGNPSGLHATQYLNVDKATSGPKGLVVVTQEFKFQRFTNKINYHENDND